MADLQDITRRRANIKHDLDFELSYMAPLLRPSLEEANDSASEVGDSIKRVESVIKTFKLVHKEYLEKNQG